MTKVGLIALAAASVVVAAVLAARNASKEDTPQGRRPAAAQPDQGGKNTGPDVRPQSTPSLTAEQLADAVEASEKAIRTFRCRGVTKAHVLAPGEDPKAAPFADAKTDARAKTKISHRFEWGFEGSPNAGKYYLALEGEGEWTDGLYPTVWSRRESAFNGEYATQLRTSGLYTAQCR